MPVILTDKQFNRIEEKLFELINVQRKIRGNTITKEQREWLWNSTIALKNVMQEHQKN